ncbi:MAG: putative lipase [Pseudonocardiales bacterium]|nr:putative lipase [Pseudonocardiales bacterium]
MIRRSLCALALVALPAAALANQASADAVGLGADGLAPSNTNQSGPVLQTAVDKLAAALRCHDAPHSSGGEPALLVHGGTLTGSESWHWNYVPALNNAGIDVCTVDLPDRALTDIQVSAEYVVYAVRQMRENYHSKVDILGHSEGPVVARWAIKFWPDVRNSVDDMVGLEAAYHGTAVTNIFCATGSCVPVAWQLSIGSSFLRALNADDETPGDVSYTSIYSLTDDGGAVPQLPQSVSKQGDGATNVPIQSICPVRVVSHVQALADAVAYAVVIDAFAHPGPADPSRIDPSVCDQLFLPGVTLDSFAIHVATISAILYAYSSGIAYPTVHREPPLRCYARSEGCI